MPYDKLNLMGHPVDISGETLPNVVVAKNDRILMSDTLHGNVQDIEADNLQELANNYIMAIIDYTLAGVESTSIVGTLRSIMNSNNDIELEVNTSLPESLIFVEHTNVSVQQVQLHVGVEKIISLKRNFTVNGVRLLDIDYRRQMCVLLLHLKS